MIVVADTSPINYLILIDAIHLLPRLYGRVFIPPAVHAELERLEAPEAVGAWIACPPNWLVTKDCDETVAIAEAGIDAGEREAIQLAAELGAKLIVIDDLRGREAAELRNLTIIGTLGVLRTAADEGLIDLARAFERLSKTNFHVSRGIVERILHGGR